MASVNKVILIGNLGADPDMRYTASGKAVVNFNMATTEKYKDEEKTEWHKIIVWDKQAESVSKYLTKGSPVYVEGKISTRSYDDKDGVKRWVTEITASNVTFLGGKKDDKKDDDLPF